MLLACASQFDFETTLDRLERAITDRGMTLFAAIDHQAAAREAGLEMPPTRVLLFGSAARGTPLMIACPDCALDLPLRVLLREAEDGSTELLGHSLARLLPAAPKAMAQALDQAFLAVMAAAANGG